MLKKIELKAIAQVYKLNKKGHQMIEFLVAQTKSKVKPCKVIKRLIQSIYKQKVSL